MDVHRIRKRLRFGRGRGRRELRRLQAVVKPQLAEVHERRQRFVDAVVEEVVQLPLGEHRHLRDGDLELVHLQRNIVAVEVAAVVDGPRLGVHHRIVVHRIELLDEYLLRLFERFEHRTQYLGRAAQRIVGLHLVLEGRSLSRVAAVKFRFALAQAAARRAYFAHPAGDFDLPGVELAGVERLGHEVVVRFDHLVEHHRSLHGPVEQASGLREVHHADSRHHGRAVGQRQPVADAEPERRYAARLHRFGRRDDFAAERDFRFADQRQRDMRQLHQVAAGADAAVARHERIYFVVEEIGQNPHHVGMYARFGVEKGLQARKHGRPHADVGQRLARAAAVRAYDVVLQAVQVGVADPVLRHGAETGVDAVYYFSLLEIFEKTVAGLDFPEFRFAERNFCPVENPAVNGVQVRIVHFLNGFMAPKIQKLSQ